MNMRQLRMLCCLAILFATCVGLYQVGGYPGTTITSAQAQQAIRLEPVVSGLTSPVYITNARDGSNRLFIVERQGIIKVLQPGSTSPTVFLNIMSRVRSTGQEQGLLGLAFHPQYQTNRRFFVYYTRPPDGAIVIAGYQASPTDPNVALTDEAEILVVPHPTFTNHNGGTINFGPDGYLYAGTGDGGSGFDPDNRAQNIEDLLGKILRIDIDRPSGTLLYSSPPDNPYFGPAPGRDEIYAIGMRNPYRFSFDRGTGQLYAGDVGQNTREEVDIITLGGNYGWRVYEGTFCTGRGPAPCDPSNYIFPITEYNTGSGGRCSVTGGYIYRGTSSVFPVGAYIFGDYCSGEILTLQGGTQSLLLDTTLNISSFGEDEAGEIYVVSLGGSVFRIVSTVLTDPIQVRLARDSGNDLRTTVTITNPTANPVAGVTVTLVRGSTLDGSSFVDGVPVPQFFGTVNPGQSISATVTLPGTASVPRGFTGLVRVDLSYTGGTFSDTQQVVTP